MSTADPARIPPLAQTQTTTSDFAAPGPCAAGDLFQPVEPHVTTPLDSGADFPIGVTHVRNASARVADTVPGANGETGYAIGPGTVLGGRYLLGKVLGAGGMCTVFEGLDRQMASRGVAGAIAIKVINPEFRGDAASALALQREFECMMKLQHPGMIRVFDLSNAHGAGFLTMELLSGETLAWRLRAHLASPESLHILLQCAQALAYAHEQGVVHGDLKPGNIFLTSEGVRLLDFGSAWRRHESVRRDRASATPAYASPQVLQGGTAEPSDDLFSLGCVAYELFTGQHPFDGWSSLEAQKSKLRPVWLPSMPARYFASIARMLAWERADRPHSVQEFLASLADADARYSGSLTVRLRPPVGKAEVASPDGRAQPGVETTVAAESIHSVQDEVHAAASPRADETTESTAAMHSARPSGAHFVDLTSSVRPASEAATRAFAAFSGGGPEVRHIRAFQTVPVSPAQQPEPTVTPPSQAEAPTQPPVTEPAVESRAAQPEIDSDETVAPQPMMSREVARQASSLRSHVHAAVLHVAALRQSLHWWGRAAWTALQGAGQAGRRLSALGRNGWSHLQGHAVLQPVHVIAAVACAVLVVAVVLLSRQALENKKAVQLTAERAHQMEVRRKRLANQQITFAAPRVDDMVMPDLGSMQIARPASVPTGGVSFKSARVYVAPGQEMAVINLSRKRSTSGGARVAWRAVPMSAKPGVDFELPETRVVRFNEGQSVRTLYIPIKRSSLTDAPGERRFQLQLQQVAGGLLPEGIQQVEVVIAAATAG